MESLEAVTRAAWQIEDAGTRQYVVQFLEDTEQDAKKYAHEYPHRTLDQLVAGQITEHLLNEPLAVIGFFVKQGWFPGMNAV